MSERDEFTGLRGFIVQRPATEGSEVDCRGRPHCFPDGKGYEQLAPIAVARPRRLWHLKLRAGGAMKVLAVSLAL